MPNDPKGPKDKKEKLHMKLNQLTLKQSVEGLKKKEFTSLELTQACLDQIKRVEPKVNAYVTVTEEEALRTSKNPADGALSGVPVAVKDNYSTKDIRTTASSHVLDNYVPPVDATVWKRTKEAGAVIVGKTNMDAWAHGSSTETSDYGATKNPWNTGHLPGGSSGGSAAAVAADECIFALGTETAGSIRQPAAWCGVVGLKPTYGRSSRYGVVAMGSSLDSPGPMTKTVEDAALVLNAIAGHDPLDATSDPRPTMDYTSVLGTSIKGMKIGYSSEYFKGVEQPIIDAVQHAMKQLESLGATLVEIKLFDPQYAIAVYTIIQRSEVSSNLARYDGIRYGYGREKFGEEAKRRIMLGTYSLSAGYYDAYYLKGEKVRTVIMEDFKRAYSEVDLIIAPTTPSLALPLGASKGHPMFGEMADVLVEPSSIAGLPGISVPCGIADGLPIGLQLIGPHFSEGLLLQAAYQYEQSTDWHTKKPTV